MKSRLLRVVLLSIVFLFFFQMAGTLIESIYILDLLNTSLDEKALGLLFFFSPLLLFVFRGKFPRWLLPTTLIVLALMRGITPYLSTTGRLISAGIGTSSALWLIILLLQNKSRNTALISSAGLALATALSVLVRAAGSGLDFSLTIPGEWLGGLLATVMLISYWFNQHGIKTMDTANDPLNVISGLGLVLVITLLLFSFTAPSVISRWVEGQIVFTLILTSLLSLGYTAVVFLHPTWVETVRTKKVLLWGGNLLFTLALLGTFLVHRVAFPASPNAPVVIVTSPTFMQQIPLILTLLLFPILFVDTVAFLQSSPQAKKPSAFISGVLLGAFALIILLFMLIFTNIWGYVDPISPYFRNQFYLPFLLLIVGISGLVTLCKPIEIQETLPSNPSELKLPLRILGAVFLMTAFFALWTNRPPQVPENKTSLTVMTYNIQQANDEDGRKSYLRQLEIIREINPDILALQESDSARIGLNNNDYVRYYASQLGYYSYFGPATSTGTYGTALLSRYPLENVRTIFSYSDLDEIGTTVAEIVVDGKRFTVFNVHPDGTETAMLTFADTLLAQSAGLENVIALGDFNLRSTEAAHQRIAAIYHNVPDSEGHIDHIFLSHNLQMVNPLYVPAPESATDHPLLYATITWE